LIRAPGWKRFAELDSLGDGYSEKELLAVLAGRRTHTPRKRRTVLQTAPPKINLLVDIQAKLRAGKGAGYARWAKIFNLKQMAQTYNYLAAHNLLDYADLEAKAEDAASRYQALSASIKAAEKRMAEIAVLKTHIINYPKTRSVYVAYRRARSEMKELLTVKANVDCLMGYDNAKRETERKEER